MVVVRKIHSSSEYDDDEVAALGLWWWVVKGDPAVRAGIARTTMVARLTTSRNELLTRMVIYAPQVGVFVSSKGRKIVRIKLMV